MSRVLSAAFAIALLAPGWVSAATPALGGVEPRGVQRGTEVEVLFNGARLEDAQEILFYEPGITVTKLEAVNTNQVKVLLKVAPDCQLGAHRLRVRTATGISDLRHVMVGNLPSLAEKEPNSDFATPQAIPMNTTVVGVADNEDVDYFVVEAKKGDRISAEVEAIRLGISLFDVYVAILNSARFELSASDDNTRRGGRKPDDKNRSMDDFNAPVSRQKSTHEVLLRGFPPLPPLETDNPSPAPSGNELLRGFSPAPDLVNIQNGEEVGSGFTSRFHSWMSAKNRNTTWVG